MSVTYFFSGIESTGIHEARLGVGTACGNGISFLDREGGDTGNGSAGPHVDSRALHRQLPFWASGD